MKRIIELDGLRGLFCLGVVVYHVRHDWLFWYWSAMDWFFMLSGFVITANLIQNRGANNLLSMFFLRRSLRIWPLYYLGLVAGLLILVLGMEFDGWGVPRASSWVQQAFFVQFFEGYWQTLNLDAYPFYLKHTWSLAVEEQFYVVWALLFVAFRRTLWIVPATAVAFIAVGIVSHEAHLHLYMLTGHMHAFGAGLLLAWLFVGERAQVLRPWLGKIFGAAAVVSVPLWFPYVAEGYSLQFSGISPMGHGRDGVTKIGFTLLWFGLTGAVALVPTARLAGILRKRVSVYLGEMCYSLYLMHFPSIVILGYLGKKHGYDPLLCATIGGFVGILSAHLLHQLVERPLLNRKVALRYRYDEPRTPSPAPAMSKAQA
jgi:peptidoglycan/LPS O-acetylase OafA/YrhL